MRGWMMSEKPNEKDGTAIAVMNLLGPPAGPGKCAWCRAELASEVIGTCSPECTRKYLKYWAPPGTVP